VSARFHVYTVSNDPNILARDLKASPDIVSGSVPLTVFSDQPNASAPYASAVGEANADYLVFAHQDVFLPAGWFDQVERELVKVQALDPAWAVVGVFGADSTGELWGHIWDSSLRGIIGEPFEKPIRVASLDEVVIILRNGTGVTFDPNLPCFHLYGTDIVLKAYSLQRSAYIIDAPVIHNTKPIRKLGPDYRRAYRFMTAKWEKVLPYPTVIVELTHSPIPLFIQYSRLLYRAYFRRSTTGLPISDPDRPAAELSRLFLGNAA